MHSRTSCKFSRRTLPLVSSFDYLVVFFLSLVASAAVKTDAYAVAVEKDLVYQDSHEWAKVEGDTATVGISDFAQVSVVQCERCSACEKKTANVTVRRRSTE